MSFLGLATKTDLDRMEWRLINAMHDAVAGEPALMALRDQLKKASDDLAKAVEQNKQTEKE